MERPFGRKEEINFVKENTSIIIFKGKRGNRLIECEVDGVELGLGLN